MKPSYRTAAMCGAVVLLVMLYLLSYAPIMCLIIRNPDWNERLATVRFINALFLPAAYFNETSVGRKYVGWWYKTLVDPDYRP